MTALNRSSQTAGHASSELPSRQYLLLLLQLALAIVVVWQFDIEPRHHLLTLLICAVGGFAVHAQLPVQFRPRWFLLTSLVGLILLVGILPAMSVVAIGLSLIGATCLPLSWNIRTLIVAAMGGAIIWWRRGSIAPFWAIVGSMFMFRMIVYLYDTRRQRERPSLARTCSYFFLLPNAFFPLFPVIDYQAFCNTYYDEERHQIYQRGVHWIITGLGHLLVYRLIKTTFLPSPLEVRSFADIGLYLASNYGLYVRISGQFHIICGVLHLFGFHLPRTHNNYFLASSFSDIWRRINIYWKDFMMKLGFLPAFFRLHSLNRVAAVLIAVMWVFLLTWLGHSWQVFWLAGEFPVRRQDAFLWLGVGSVVAASSLWDYRRASKESAHPSDGFRWMAAVWHCLKVMGVFVTVSLFWAHWTNVETFRYLMFTTTELPVTRRDVLILGGAVAAFTVIGTIVQYLRHRVIHDSPSAAPSVWRSLFRGEPLPFDVSTAMHLGAIAAVIILVRPETATLFGERAAGFVKDFQTEQTSAAEAFTRIDGYYEQLNEASLPASPYLGEPPGPHQPAGELFIDLTRPRDDLMELELIPGWSGELKGAHVTVNRWGMRDRDRSLMKPPGVYRIAVVGSSAVMGYGVEDEETFTRLLENQLNTEPPSSGVTYEVLNFGVGLYLSLHRRMQIEKKVLAFQPDLILYIAHQDELYKPARRLAEALANGIALDDPCLEQLVKQVGITPSTSHGRTQSILGRHQQQILECTYSSMVETCRQADVSLIWVELPVAGVESLPFDPTIAMEIARSAGFDVLDLSDWSDQYDATDVMVGTKDNHPNKLGHKLIARRLFVELRELLVEHSQRY